jgi:hypothetical protein
MIRYDTKVMNLGIYFNSFLNWDSHINYPFKLRKLFWIKNLLPESDRLKLVGFLILPHLWCHFLLCCGTYSEGLVLSEYKNSHFVKIGGRKGEGGVSELFKMYIGIYMVFALRRERWSKISQNCVRILCMLSCTIFFLPQLKFIGIFLFFQ